MSKYHISADGEPRLCRASTACPLGAPSEHYLTKEEARRAYEEAQSGSFSNPKELTQALRQEFPGVDLYLASGSGDFVVVDSIIVPEAQRGTGVGTQVMERIITEADKKGWKLALTPDTAYGATSVARLKRFYKRFGFVENKGRNRDFTTRESMVRKQPQA